MNLDFESLLLLAVEWAAEQEEFILWGGVALTAAEMEMARRLGIEQAERVRLLNVRRVPTPQHPELAQACEQFGLLGPNTTGLTLRYGIFVRTDYWRDPRLVAHELVHTRQYERLGGFLAFLRPYLAACIEPPGYPHGPLEQEAVRASAELV